MNTKERLTLGELNIHVKYIRDSIDDIKEITQSQQKDIDLNKMSITKIVVVGSIIAFIITVCIPIAVAILT